MVAVKDVSKNDLLCEVYCPTCLGKQISVHEDTSEPDQVSMDSIIMAIPSQIGSVRFNRRRIYARCQDCGYFVEVVV